ncbi:MAG: hypothetical protein J6X02_05055 [Bacilli bacterium]|nr:hypothetical protein [Bacilli bacterium]
MNGIKCITYINNDSKFVIDFTSLTVLDNDILLPINKKLASHYLQLLLSITDEWEDEYIDRTLTDGDLWNFVITYQNGKEKKYIGRSSYPYNFDAFLDLNREIINEVYYV